MKGVFIGSIYHCMPSDNFNDDGNRSIICRLCFGPIEVIEYGITEEKQFYFNHTYPEGLGEDDIKPHFEFIEKERMLRAICHELTFSEVQKCDDMLSALELEKKKIEEDY